MLAIEQVMSRLSTTSKPSPSSAISPTLSVADQKITEAIQAENQTLREELRQLQVKYDELNSEKTDLQTGIHDMEHSLSQLSGVGKVDFILKTEIENLKGEGEK
ncbi:hypothetical protein BC829DRAFT_1488 [Chytridium lagenaria]|nr:hypothetical protein BC829DRAFT_1488 [Chytridium lagenaria]